MIETKYISSSVYPPFVSVTLCRCNLGDSARVKELVTDKITAFETQHGIHIGAFPFRSLRREGEGIASISWMPGRSICTGSSPRPTILHYQKFAFFYITLLYTPTEFLGSGTKTGDRHLQGVHTDQALPDQHSGSALSLSSSLSYNHQDPSRSWNPSSNTKCHGQYSHSLNCSIQSHDNGHYHYHYHHHHTQQLHQLQQLR